LASTRLHDMWFQQEFLDHQISLRVGQIALDDEFYISQYSAGFVSSSFGCPDILSTDLPSGGPCYPFAVPGARLRVASTSNLTLSAAVFNGNPAPRGPGDPQVRNSSGTNFLIGGGGFMPIAELAYSFDEQPISSTPLSDVKLGAWYHTGESCRCPSLADAPRAVARRRFCRSGAGSGSSPLPRSPPPVSRPTRCASVSAPRLQPSGSTAA
jgi:porin